MTLPSIIHPLTGLLADIAELADRATAIALARVYGGRRVYIPETVNEGHPLAIALGLGPARVLSDMYAGETLDVPMGPYTEKGSKSRAIEALLESGLSNGDIAKEVGCSLRLVLWYKSNRGSRIDPNQLDMFGEDDAAA